VPALILGAAFSVLTRAAKPRLSENVFILYHETLSRNHFPEKF